MFLCSTSNHRNPCRSCREHWCVRPLLRERKESFEFAPMDNVLPNSHTKCAALARTYIMKFALNTLGSAHGGTIQVSHHTGWCVYFLFIYVCAHALLCVCGVSHLEHMQSETAAGVYQAANMQYFRGEKWCLAFFWLREWKHPVSERRFYEWEMGVTNVLFLEMFTCWLFALLFWHLLAFLKCCYS